MKQKCKNRENLNIFHFGPLKILSKEKTEFPRSYLLCYLCLFLFCTSSPTLTNLFTKAKGNVPNNFLRSLSGTRYMIVIPATWEVEAGEFRV
jgi:hypothetical protein